MPNRIIPTIGEKFARLTVTADLGIRKKITWVRVQCDCGTTMERNFAAVRNGNTTSCGCRQREVVGNMRRTHGRSRSDTYNIWASMKWRCETNERYVSRGITVCSRWNHSYENFLADMGERPPHMTIERIDNNKGYAPTNCKWATDAEQRRNKEKNMKITHNGITMCAADWNTLKGFPRNMVYSRIKLGWSVERALSTPPKQRLQEISSMSPSDAPLNASPQ